MKRMKSGMKVHLDAGKGQLTILEQDSKDQDKCCEDITEDVEQAHEE